MLVRPYVVFDAFIYLTCYLASYSFVWDVALCIPLDAFHRVERKECFRVRDTRDYIMVICSFETVTTIF